MFKINLKKEFLMYLLVFYFFYMPDLSFISPTLMNSIIICLLDVFLFIRFKNDVLYLLSKLINRKYIAFPIVIIFLSAYTLIITFFHSLPLSVNFAGVIIIIKTILFLLIIIIINKNKINYISKVKFIINVGNIQAIICCIMLLIPPIKNIANMLYIQNIPDYFTSPQFGITESRIFGICGDFTFSCSIFLAMLAALSLCFYFYKKEKYYLISSLLCIFSSALNGRTGIFIYLIVLIFLIYKYWDKKWLYKKNYILFIFISLIICYFFRNTVYIKWVFSGVKEIVGLFGGSKIGTFSILFNEFIFFPNNFIDFLFGVGGRVFADAGQIVAGKASDIGYINEIFRGGIVYIVIFYFSLYFILKKFMKSLTIEHNNTFSITIIFTITIFFILSNFKGEALSGSSILYLGLYMIYIQPEFCNILKGDK